MEEAEDVRSESRASGVGTPDLAEAVLVADPLEAGPVGEESLDAQAERELFTGHAAIGGLVAHGHRPLVDAALEPGGVFDLHLDLSFLLYILYIILINNYNSL